MKNLCVKLGGFGALLICLPVMWRIHEGDRFNPVSFFLWTFLSLICTIVLIRAKKGGHTMMAGYVLSDISIGIYAMIKNGKVEFGHFEWFIVALTIICTCLYVWSEVKQNFTPAVITNASACMLAGIPQMIDAFRNPHQVNFFICSLYMAVSALTYYGEKPTLNGRLISGLSFVYWLIIICGAALNRH